MNASGVDRGRTVTPRQRESGRVMHGAPPLGRQQVNNGYNYNNYNDRNDRNGGIVHGGDVTRGRRASPGTAPPSRISPPGAARPNADSAGERAAAARHARRRRAQWLLIIAMLGISCILIYVISVFLGSFFVVGEVEIAGESPYSAQEIMSAAGLSYGDALYKLDRSEVEKAITDKLPYIEDAVVGIKLPSYVYITVRSEGAVMYTELPGGYYALSREMRVLECASSPVEFISSGLVYIELPEIESAVVGMTLALADGTDPIYIGELVEALLGSDLGGRVSKIFADERFNTVLSVDGRFRVRLGSDADASIKALAAAKVIEQNDFRGYDTAEIDVSDPSAVIVVGRDKLDLQNKRG